MWAEALRVKTHCLQFYGDTLLNKKVRAQFVLLHALKGRRNSAENNTMPRNSANNFAGVNNVDSPSLNTVEKI